MKKMTFSMDETKAILRGLYRYSVILEQQKDSTDFIYNEMRDKDLKICLNLIEKLEKSIKI